MIFILRYSLVIYVLTIIFGEWFTNRLITSGDFWPLYPSQMNNYTLLPHAWNAQLNNGSGGDGLILAWNHFFLNLPIYFWGKLLGLPYIWVERLGYLFPILILGAISMSIWTSYFFKSSMWLRLASGIVYLTNTYILLAIGGGQMGIVFGYLFAPIVFVSLMKLVNRLVPKGNEILHLRKQLFIRSIILGVLLACELNFDLRSFYVVLVGISLYMCFYLFTSYIQLNSCSFKILGKIIIFVFVIPLLVTGMLHAFWIIPAIYSINSGLMEQFKDELTTSSAVIFLSFAKFPQSLSLLHPNWPENIFGKTYFMKPEFIINPILSYSSLLLFNLSNKKKEIINNIKTSYRVLLFFSLLGLFGAFLTKGSNEPFGEVYLWMFNYVPGFIMFRDPTKWYLFIGLAYSVLIPLSMLYFYNFLHDRKNLFVIIVCLSSIYWLYTIAPAITGDLGGLYKSTHLPEEYTNLEKKISSDHEFYRTLWFPKTQRFAYFSDIHPRIDTSDLFNTSKVSDLLEIIKGKDKTIERPLDKLQELGVRYIIVPFDSEKEIYLKDRIYDATMKEVIEKDLDSLSWLNKQAIGRITIYELKNYKYHIWSENANIQYTPINPSKYNIKVTNLVFPTQVVFSEFFNKNWSLYDGNEEVKSIPYKSFNSFKIVNNGSYTLIYKREQLLNIGFIVSSVSSVCIGIILIFLTKKKVIGSLSGVLRL